MNLRSLWPIPQLGLDAIHDQLQPLPTAQNGSYHQQIPREPRGTDFNGEYNSVTYSTGMDHHILPSLGREYLYTSSYTALKLGGPHYPLDYGFGPGYHADCMTPQFYMRPGIPPGVQTLLAGGRQI
jgi:hypothetical protein